MTHSAAAERNRNYSGQPVAGKRAYEQVERPEHCRRDYGKQYVAENLVERKRSANSRDPYREPVTRRLPPAKATTDRRSVFPAGIDTIRRPPKRPGPQAIGVQMP